MNALNKFAFATVLLAGLQSASADPLTYTLNFWGIANDDDEDTTNSPANIGAGQSQLRVEVSSESLAGNYADFKFYNVGSTPMTIAEVYFDDTDTLSRISGLTDSGSGVSFTAASVNPPNLPGGGSVSPKFSVTAGLAADADSPANRYGVGAGEWLNVRFDLTSGSTFAKVLEELTGGGLRVGLHVIGFTDDGSESFVNNPIVPLPPAAWGGLALLGGIGAARLKARRQAVD